MALTDELKKQIDEMNYEQMLHRWRFAPSGDPMFESEAGEYFKDRMTRLRDFGEDHVSASKKIGWEP